MKNMLFFINTLAGGGAEKVIVDLLNSLDTAKYSIDLVTVSGGVHEKRLSDKINYYKIIRNDSFISNLLKKIIYKLPLVLFNFLFIRKKYDIEIAYLEGFPTRVIASRKNNAKKLAFVHCDVSVKHVLNGFYKNKTDCLSEYSRFNKVCFVSNLAKNGFEKTYGFLENSLVVHNVINVDEILVKSKECNDFNFNTDGLKIISVGRLSKEKGYDRLIKVASVLEKKYKFEICILGEGDHRDYLEKLISDLNVKSVRLLGYKENPYSYMVKADMFVCSSYFEGYSTVVTECVMLGIPVLTTDCAGMDEILDGSRYGIIVGNDDVALSDGLEQILSDTLKLTAFSNQNKRYSVDNAVMEYENLFKEILI